MSSIIDVLVASVISGLISSALRDWLESYIRSFPERALSLFRKIALILATTSILLFSIFLLIISIRYVDKIVLEARADNYIESIFIYIIMFSVFCYNIHLIAYMCSRFLVEIIGQDWFQKIDYIYYPLGAFLVASLIIDFGENRSNASNITNLQIIFIRLQVVLSIIMFSMKILKTTASLDKGKPECLKVFTDDGGYYVKDFRSLKNFWPFRLTFE